MDLIILMSTDYLIRPDYLMLPVATLNHLIISRVKYWVHARFSNLGDNHGIRKNNTLCIHVTIII